MPHTTCNFVITTLEYWQIAPVQIFLHFRERISSSKVTLFSYNWPISDVVVFEVTLVRLLLLPSIYHKPQEQHGWFFACEKKEGKIIQKGASFKVTAAYTWLSEVNIINLHVILSFHLSVQFCFKENVSSIGNDSPNLLPLWRYIPTMCHFEVTYTDLLCLNIF